ncbi:MAG TPA: 2-amino-4-hydroxy-6-hydroxymethyldihydropteridine diphosphokinase [Salinivirgaceae bacterium]|nr:2-amino-4-hydroxy-6-hydroxymethyldihydropteridine diphosphokinase [Salinivirgaceae bacterium]
MEYTILLGSNLGNKQIYLERAIEHLSEYCGKVVKQSQIYETTSWGFEAPTFLNQAVIVDSELAPNEFLIRSQKIEKELGREEQNKTQNGYCSRTIDIDILFVDDLIINSLELTVPHKELANRRFVLVPLSEIQPNKVHPVLNKTVLDLLHTCTDNLEVKIFCD